MMYLLSIIAVVMAAISQMLLKSSSRENHGSIVKDYLNFKVLLGYSILGCSLLINIYAMHIGLMVKELSIIESLNYLFVPALAYLLFGERISKRQCVAIIIMLIGMFIFFN